MIWKDIVYDGNGSEYKHCTETTCHYDAEITISRVSSNCPWDVRFRKDLRQIYQREVSKGFGLRATVIGLDSVERLYRGLMVSQCTEPEAVSLFESKIDELDVVFKNTVRGSVLESIVSVSDHAEGGELPQFAFEVTLRDTSKLDHVWFSIRDVLLILKYDASMMYYALHKILAL